MNRPWKTWFAFAACLAVGIAAMAWTTAAGLALDRAEADARRRAAAEERVRLALWRMDSSASAFLAGEGARPYFDYSAFFPAERAYTRMFSEIGKGEVLVPSPLLALPAPEVRLHFQVSPAGELSSPQVPAGNMRDLAEASYTQPARIEEAAGRLAALGKLAAPEVLRTALAAKPSRPPNPVLANAPNPPARQEPDGQRDDSPVQGLEQQKQNSQEWQARYASSRKVQMAGANSSNSYWTEELDPVVKAAPPAASVDEGILKPIWFGAELLLARRVSVNGEDYVQGCWVDWEVLRRQLLESIRDLLPSASLVPASAGPQEDPSRLLASIPARLVAGEIPLPAALPASPIRIALAAAWGCLLVAALAVGGLLNGAVTLSERRGAFVSAVTHELRTPLTTFRMYTEMLAEGMVADEARRKGYLGTLRAEADRLGHLIENVLAYARLERRGPTGRRERVDLAAFLDRTRDRLAERASQAGMEVAGSAGAALPAVVADPTAVEQVLFNLVDNACKYAASASDRRIHIEASGNGRFGELRVRDHGPGIAPAEARRLFKPFRKSARDAANSAPGVGLGLALSRRLARSMGGDLRIEEKNGEGASFVLMLPVAEEA